MKAKLSNLASLKHGLFLILVTFSVMSCVEDFGSDYRNNDVAVEADFDYQFDVTGPGNFFLDGFNGNVGIAYLPSFLYAEAMQNGFWIA